MQPRLHFWLLLHLTLLKERHCADLKKYSVIFPLIRNRPDNYATTSTTINI
jgi:hypothetical protein